MVTRGCIRRTIRVATALAVTVALPAPARGQGPATAAARGGTPNAVEILVGRPDGLKTSPTVAVRVRIRGELAGLQAYLRGERMVEVTHHFRSRGRDLWTAKFGRGGEGVVLGRNHLYVQVRRPSGAVETEAVHFTVAHRLSRMLHLDVRGGHAPLTVRVRAPRAEAVRATLNGKDVGAVFEPDGAGRWRARLAANDGVDFGGNLLTVTAYNTDGEYDRGARKFSVPRTRPLVGAGRDTTVRTGTAVQLDGRSTRASRPGRGLELHWQIASRPEGSTATLSGASSLRPSLRPDVPGDYTIRLRASEGAGAVAADTVTVSAQPDVLPSGVPVTTMVSPTSPGIVVGTEVFAMGPGWLQMLALDRSTLVPSQAIPNPNTAYPGTEQGMAALASDVGKLSPDDLVFLSGSGQAANLSTPTWQTLVGVLSGLGGIIQPGTGTVTQLGSGQWSLIGIPGLPPGTAYQNVGLQLDPALPVGSVSGFFQEDTSKNWTFTWPPSYLPFDTQAAGTSATQNVLAVGERAYTSAAVPSGESAFHVLWLDSGSLAFRGQYTAVTSETGCGADEPLLCLSDLASTLQSIVQSGSPALLLVATIGQPAFDYADTASWPPWALTTQMLNSMGAQPAVLLGLDGTGDYSFVGVQGLLQLAGPNSGTELSQVVTGAPTARLVGLLTRNRQGNWMAGPNGSPGPGINPRVFLPRLQLILAQPDTPFPPFSGTGQQEAEMYIARNLKPPLPFDPKYGLRANYWGNPSLDWGTNYTTLGTMPPCTDSPCSLGFAYVQQTLLNEFPLVELVLEFFNGGGPQTSLAGVLGTAFGGGGVTFDGISLEIQNLFDLPPAPPQGGNAGDILNAVTTIASGLTGPIPIVGSAISGAFNLARGVNMLFQALYNTSGGAPGLDAQAFGADVYDWSGQLEGAWTGSLGGIGLVSKLLVSDAGRLTAAATMVATAGDSGFCLDDTMLVCSDDADYGGAPCIPGWGLDPASATSLTEALENSLTRYMWWSMLPVAVQVGQCRHYPNGALFGRTVSPLDVLQAGMVRRFGSDHGVDRPYLFLVVSSQEQYDTVLDAATLGPLFASGSGNLGLQKEYFFAGAWVDAKGAPVSPGFVYRSPEDWELIFIYGC